jgi:hypothetical protein
MEHIFIKCTDTLLIGLQLFINTLLGRTIRVNTFIPFNLMENYPNGTDPRKKSNDVVSLIHQY